MSQLSFDGFPGDHMEPELSSANTPRPRPWYKGRALSHSSISLYQACPQKWKFRYVDKVPEKPRAFFSFGKSVHGSLEYLFSKAREVRPVLEDVLTHYKSNWISEGYETPAQEKWFFQEGDRILRGFYAKHQSDFEKILKVEFKFTIDVDGVPVTGYIDRIDNAPNGGIALLDYKTGKAFDKSRVRSDPQLTLYQMAARELLGRPVESVTLYHLNSLTPLTVPPHSEKHEQDLSATIVQTAQDISKEKFDPKPDEKGQCQWCDYLQICPAFSGRKRPLPFSSLPESSIPSLVDRYAKLERKLEQLSGEKNDLEKTLKSHMVETNTNELEGEYFSIRLDKDEKGTVLGLKTENIRDEKTS